MNGAIPAGLSSWIRDHARGGAAWDELSLRRFLEERGAICPAVLVEWERALHALRDGCSMASPYLLELSDTCFGAMATGAGAATLPGNGGRVVIIGRFAWGGALGLDERGRLFSSDGDSWTPVARSPHVHLARLALAGVARDEGRMHLVLPERARSAARRAARCV